MILTKFKDTIKKYNLIQRGDKIVVGVSGGSDSVALIYLLNSLKDDLKITLYIAHLDHMLRKDSYKDAEFVRGLAKSLKIRAVFSTVNIKDLAKLKDGCIEEIARNARLGFLFNTAKNIGAKKIALGHNQDDQAETVLMRILRGTGLCGLSGIMPKKNIAGFQIIRPLIEVKRKEIESFLKRKGIKARTDLSNTDDIYFRNKIRHKLLPLLEEGYNKNIKGLLANMAQNLGQDYDYLSSAAKRSMKGSSARINLAKLARLHQAIQRIALRNAISYVQGSTRRITFKHMEEIEDLILNRPANSIVDLPKGISVIKKQTCLFFYKR